MPQMMMHGVLPPADAGLLRSHGNANGSNWRGGVSKYIITALVAPVIPRILEPNLYADCPRLPSFDIGYRDRLVRKESVTAYLFELAHVPVEPVLAGRSMG